MIKLDPIKGEFCSIDTGSDFMVRTMKQPNFKTDFIFCANYNHDDLSKDNRIFFWLFMLNTREAMVLLK